MAIKILNEYQIDLQQIKYEIEEVLKQSSTEEKLTSSSIPLVKQAEKIIKMTYLEAKYFKSPIIGTEHLLLSILRDGDNVACSTLNKYGVLYENAKDEYESIVDEKIEPESKFPGSAEEEPESFSSSN